MARSGGLLTVRVIGPLEVSVDGRRIELTAGRLRSLLTTLALSAGHTVSVDGIATALWGTSLPENPGRSVQTYVSRLRVVLGTVRIAGGPTGYLLDALPEQVDALRFGQLVDAAASAPDPAAECALLDEALSLWRGMPFEDVRSEWLAQFEAPRLIDRRLTAIERRVDLALADGRPEDLAAQLQELAALHPLRESLWARLLLVLYRCGRPAEALERYETVRKHLAEELGVDPGPELRQMYADLLSDTPPQLLHDGSTTAFQAVVARQLPADVDGFIGRTATLEALDARVHDWNGRTTTAVVISVIAGAAGIGKTALAVHWAHSVAHLFPDGQLYANLRGFHPSGRAMKPAEAVRGFLDALGIPQHRVPFDLDAQVGLYRSALAGKRVLLVLDNARDADQVRPLLPGSPGCMVVVTSRCELTSLVAAEAARPLILDLLSVDEARRMLVGRLGAARIAAEPAAADEIVTRCARLPLALAIAAALAAARPTFSLAAVAAQLGEGGSSLDGLATGDPATDARAVFSWSYQALSREAARLFRLLGLHPGPDVTRAAAASLAAAPVSRVRPLLDELCHSHLLAEHMPGRYTFHDLLRVYAAELADAYDSGPDQRVALHRLFDHTLHTAFAAARLLVPQRSPISLPPIRPGAWPEPLSDHIEATRWFATERQVLLAATERAYDTGFDAHAWQLAWSLTNDLDRHGHWHELTSVLHTATAAATRLGDRAGLAYTYRNLALPELRRGRYEESAACLERSLDLFRDLDDPTNEAATLLGLATTAGRRGRITEALHHTQTALALSQAVGNRAGQAEALNGVAWYHVQLSQHRQAIVHCEQALALHRETGHRRGEAATLDTLGLANHHLGDHERSTTYYRQALDLYREIGDTYYEADTLVHLGDAYLIAGHADAARDALHQALTILDEFDDQHMADEIRAKLRSLDRSK